MASFTNSRAGDDRIGSLAQSTGCPVETIRYYERVGLVPPPLRTQGGHRVYGPEHRERLAFILRGRELGFSLEEIRELIGLTEQGDRACVTVEAIARSHIGSIRTRIARLTRMLEALERLARDCRRGRSPSCPILETLSAAPEAEQVRPARGPRRSASQSRASSPGPSGRWASPRSRR